MRKLIILVDDRGFFYSSTKKPGASLDVDKLKDAFLCLNYEVEILYFYQVDFRQEYKDTIILYQSTEDPDGKYKDYIEDIILGLLKLGAILVPDFDKFRAHHNKVYMEILRDVYKIDDGIIYSKKYGTLEDFKRDKEKFFPAVIKPGFGSRGEGVCLVKNKENAFVKAESISRTFTFMNIKRRILSILKRSEYVPISNHRSKFIVQNFINGIYGDYKVLIYYNKYYVLSRHNRKNDFRASGSGNFYFPKNPSEELLNFAEKTFIKFRVPYASFDIAIKNNTMFLFEFQFVSFGQYALEKLKFYFIKKKKEWIRVVGPSNLEDVLSNSVHFYLQNK